MNWSELSGDGLKLLAVLSRQSNFSVGCYCDDETRCHRSVLRALLTEHGAEIEPGMPEPEPGSQARRRPAGGV